MDESELTSALRRRLSEAYRAFVSLRMASLVRRVTPRSSAEFAALLGAQGSGLRPTELKEKLRLEELGEELRRAISLGLSRSAYESARQGAASEAYFAVDTGIPDAVLASAARAYIQKATGHFDSAFISALKLSTPKQVDVDVYIADDCVDPERAGDLMHAIDELMDSWGLEFRAEESSLHA